MDPALYVAAINRRHNTTPTFEDFTAADSKISLRQVTCGQGNTSLHVATIGGNETFVEKTLQSYPLLVYEANMKGQTALHIAARLGHPEVASLLISYARRTDGVAGARTENLLTMVDHEKNTALHEAVRYGHYDIVELLIEEEPSLTCLTNDCEESPLFIAVDRKFYGIAWRILETFPNCSCSGRNGMTVMHAAVIRLDFISLGYFRFPVNNFVNELLEKCKPEILEVQDQYGWMPLHYAARIGALDVIELFLETNKSLAYIKDKQGMSPLHISAGNGRAPALYVLIRKCPDICELLDKRRRTALHVAVETGYITSTKALLNIGVFGHLINEKDLQGNTALHLAALHGHYKILKRLVNDDRVDKGAINEAGMTVIDIIRSSSSLSNDRKISFTAMLKSKGSEPSLERRVFVRERIIEQIDEIRRYEMIQETHYDDQMSNVPAAKNNIYNHDHTSGSTTSTASTTTTNKEQEETIKTGKRVESYFGKWPPELVKNLANINLLVATIIVSITFSAAITMPGGYDNTDGQAILRTNNSFRYFLAFDSLAFGCSAASMLIHFLVAFTSSVIHEKYSYPVTAILFLTLLSIVSTVSAFVSGTNAVLQLHRSGFGLSAITALLSFTLPVAFFFIRIVVVLFKKLHLMVATDK